MKAHYPSLVSRYLEPGIKEDLTSKMVLIGGPRQVGKTTLAFQILGGTKSHPGYLNWDISEDRVKIRSAKLPTNEIIIVLDELHKYARWRNLLKGFYDKYNPSISFLVTGSARLDHYRRGGDSLQGRYHYYRLHPFSLSEISKNPNSSDIEHLLKFGGFPEPCMRGNERFLRRWQNERLSRVVYEDIRDLENIREVSLLELLLDALPERVGSPLSVKNLREDLEVAHKTVERWIQILERLYICFRISPFGGAKIRAVKKEKKLYFWDWTQVPEKGVRFENFVACQLLKYCHFVEDTEGYRMELRFLRDTDRREVDFVVLKDRKPEFAVECKFGEKRVNPAIQYFKTRTSITKFYQVHLGAKNYFDGDSGTKVMNFIEFSKELNLP